MNLTLPIKDIYISGHNVFSFNQKRQDVNLVEYPYSNSLEHSDKISDSLGNEFQT